jgi:hypothetical protein
MPDPDDAQPIRPVRPEDVWSVLVIAPAVAWVWVWFAAPGRFSTAALVSTAVAGAVIFGLPAWFWAADHLRTRLTDRLLLGGVAGIGLPVMVFLSATAGLLVRAGSEDVQLVLAHGAPIPAYGVLPWPIFLSFTAQCAGVGAVSGAIEWAIARARGKPR